MQSAIGGWTRFGAPLLRPPLQRARAFLVAALIAAVAGFGVPVRMAGAGSPNGAGLQDNDLAAQQAKYRCLITAYLAAIHRAPFNGERDRFLILNSAGRAGRYVQCAFFDGDKQLHCEAASGFYWSEIARFMSPARVAVVAALGYSTDASQGNFVQEHPVPDAHALYEIAGLLVETLVRVYELQANDTLEFVAPLVVSAPKPETGGNRECSPRLISRLPVWFDGDQI